MKLVKDFFRRTDVEVTSIHRSADLKPQIRSKDIFLVVSRFKEDLTWLHDFKMPHLIYNKSNELLPAQFNAINVSNRGGNQYDIVKFIYDQYEDLPNKIAFLQGMPFDHCDKAELLRLLDLGWFAPLESYGHLRHRRASRRSQEVDGGYAELNNSWYIDAHNRTILKRQGYITCPVSNFEEFMNLHFLNYKHLPWLRFAPGSQYLVESWRCKNYSRSFWRRLMNFLPDGDVNGGTEAHILERAMWLIFAGIYKERSDGR